MIMHWSPTNPTKHTDAANPTRKQATKGNTSSMIPKTTKDALCSNIGSASRRVRAALVGKGCHSKKW